MSAVQFSPTPGTYSSDQNIELTSATADAIIHYTTDGSAPDETSAVYSTPIPVAGDGTSVTITAIATKSGMTESSVVSGIFTIDYMQVSTPQMDPPAGTYTSDQTVEITCDTTGAVIYYTTDGSTPDGSSAVYSTPIPVAGDGTSITISAIAVMGGMIDSTVQSAPYSIDYPDVETPLIALPAGMYTSDQSTNITCGTSGAAIHYTTDGSTPTEASPVFSTAIQLQGNGSDFTINAIAVLAGYSNSGMASSSYNIRYVVYYAVNDYIYISYDGGTFWNTVNFSSHTINSVFADKYEIYVGGSSYLSYYDGTTWNDRTFSGNVVSLFEDSNYLYVSTDTSGLNYSSNKGASFGMTLAITTQRAVYVDNTGIMYIASNGGLWYSNSTASPFFLNYQPTPPASHSPITTSYGLPTDDLYDVYVIGNDRYLATASGVSVYTDTGDDPGTDVDYTTSTGGVTYGVCSDGTNIYAATANGLSIYNGSSWSTAIASIKCNRVRKAGSVIYAATDSGLYVSSDEGATWNVYSAGSAIKDVCVSPQ